MTSRWFSWSQVTSVCASRVRMPGRMLTLACKRGNGKSVTGSSLLFFLKCLADVFKGSTPQNLKLGKMRIL
jgi:hypothetical protein